MRVEWTAERSEELERVVAEAYRNAEMRLGGRAGVVRIRWGDVATRMGLSKPACRMRYGVIKNGTASRAWSPEDLERMEAVMALQGEEPDWREVAEHVGKPPCLCRAQWKKMYNKAPRCMWTIDRQEDFIMMEREEFLAAHPDVTPEAYRNHVSTERRDDLRRGN